MENRRNLHIQAHRCFGGEAGANTEESLEKALHSGIKSIETDVFLSKDGVMYAIHGDNEFGECQMKERDKPEASWKNLIIGDLTSEIIDSLTYKHSEGHKICRLTDIIDFFKNSDIMINVEIKEFDPKITGMVVDAFEAAGMLNRLFISSFFHYHRKLLHKHLEQKKLPHVSFGFITYSIYHASSDEVLDQTMPGDRLTLSQHGLRLHMGGYPELFRKANEKQLKIGVWFDGTDSGHLETLETYKTLADLGIDTIITNCPTKALQLQKELLAESP